MLLFTDRNRLMICEDKLYSIEKQLVQISNCLVETKPAPSEPRSVMELLEEDIKLAAVGLGKALKNEQDSSISYWSIRNQENASKISAYLETIEVLHKILNEKVNNPTSELNSVEIRVEQLEKALKSLMWKDEQTASKDAPKSVEKSMYPKFRKF